MQMNLKGDDIVWTDDRLLGGIVLGAGIKWVSVLWKDGTVTKITREDIVMIAPFPCPTDWQTLGEIKDEAKHCKDCLKLLVFPELVKDFDNVWYAYKQRLGLATTILNQYKAVDNRA